MQADILIVGQGLCGSWLSYYLQKAGISFVLIDEARTNSSSRVAAGVINPVTGRRIVKTWMIDELMPFAWEMYGELGQTVGKELIRRLEVIDFFPSPQMRLAFTDRVSQDSQYLALPANENDWLDKVNYEFGYGIISPAYLVDLTTLLDIQRKKLQERGQLRSEVFNPEELELLPSGIRYRDIETGKVIFCDGVGGFGNPYFRNLPYAASKGEALLVEIPDLPTSQILKKSYALVPWKDHIFWLGSTYLWEFENDLPSPGFYQLGQRWLQSFVKTPVRILDHLAAIRPATLERRPFVGLHPLHPQLGIFNGMGTKGCSLAPYFAQQFVEHLQTGKPLQPEGDIGRFRQILSRV